MKKMFSTLLFAYGATAFAGTNARLEMPVTYHPEAGVVENVRTECQIEDMLASRIGGALGKINGTGNGVQEPGVKAEGAQTLRIQITHVLGVGGGAWSGPKAITVMVEVLEDGKTVRKTKITRWSMGGAFGAFKGTCSILERCANAITRDLSRWVQNPAYKIVEERAPKEANSGNTDQPPAVEPAQLPAGEVVDKKSSS